jgi:ABC-type multidrug transport system ATPase subunit/pSer/pThr/pTyr-binding forkhead associated (FHA) protein/ABC-type multidrug transport system permease subunit
MSSSTPVKTVFNHSPYLILNNQGEFSESYNLVNKYHRLGRGKDQVDLVVPDTWSVVSNWQATLRKVDNNYYIYDGDGTKPSTNRLFINNILITPEDGYCLQHQDEIKIGQDSKACVIITYYDPSQTSTPPPQKYQISLQNRSVVIGRDEGVTMQLEAPTVSRKHATIDSDDQGRYILKDYSTNGVYVNDEKVNGSAVIKSRDLIRIGPYILTLQGDNLVITDQGKNIRIDLDNLVRTQPPQLNHISLPIEPGQLVAIVGGSGTGKSSLIKAMLGISPTQEGTVYLNGDNLPRNFNIYCTQIGYVPQDDIIHRDLTVNQVLTYAAKLRLSDINVPKVVKQTLAEIELSDRAQTLVRDLSGGQIKRVSIGVELLADPKLFFLDEPTSGLDPGLDQKMMQLLQGLARQGRTVILVTHATNNITLCDRLIFLGLQGHLCYFGPPEKTLDFFQVTDNNFANIYLNLESLPAVQSAAETFKESPDYQQYITSRLSIAQHPNNPKIPQAIRGSFLKQLLVLSERYLQLILRDKLNLIFSLLTAPIGIALIKLAIPANPVLFITPNDPAIDLAPLTLRVLFVFTCAAIWIGLFSSLSEIIKEQEIYTRERLVNLGILAYLGSKYLVLGGLAIVQSLIISLTIIVFFKPPVTDLLPWSLGLLITTTLTIFTAQSLGLMISAWVKNSNQANTSLPILLIPQIIFSGVLFKMDRIGQYLSWLMLSRWSVSAYGILVNVNKMIPELQGGMSIFESAPLDCPLPFEASPVYNYNWQNLLLAWGVLLLHIFIYVIITFFLQQRKDIRRKINQNNSR